MSEENGGKRTIDQRLEALIERHEALTQSVELIAGSQRKVEEQQLKLTVSQAKTDKHIRQLVRLAKLIFVDHEKRLLALEDGEDEEEDDGAEK